MPKKSTKQCLDGRLAEHSQQSVDCGPGSQLGLFHTAVVKPIRPDQKQLGEAFLVYVYFLRQGKEGSHTIPPGNSYPSLQ
ncbi:MAG: hypothetical protein IIA92_11905 [Chloroflexi bacterium]|nr:hypothetical protein [Chloroflexota bacterium]